MTLFQEHLLSRLVVSILEPSLVELESGKRSYGKGSVPLLVRRTTLESWNVFFICEIFMFLFELVGEQLI